MTLLLRRPLAAMIMMITAMAAHAQAPSEHELKAAFIYNFIQFTQWPEKALSGGTLNVCITPGTALHIALQPISGKAVHGRVIALMPLQPDQLKACHVMVADAADRARGPLLKRGIAGNPTLSITDDAELMRSGFVIGMVVDNGKIGFSIDNSYATELNLSISSRLLRLARSVK